MAGDPMDFPVTAPGATQAAAEFDRVAQSMGKSVGSWDKMSQGSSKAAAGLGAMSSALGPLGDEFGALGQSVSRAGGIITNMTALLGGPWGVAIGLAAAAVGFMAKQFVDAKEESDKLNESLKEQAENSLRLVEIQNTYLKTLTDIGEENEDFLEKGRKAKQAEDLAALEQQIELAEAEGRGPRERRGGGGGFKPRATEFGEASDFKETDPFAEKTLADENRDAVAEINAEFDQAEKAAALERERAHLEGIEAMRQGQHERDIARMEEAARLEEQRNGFISGMLEDQGKLAIRAANEAAKGHAMGKKAALQSIGDALVARGTSAIAEGGIWSSVPFMWGSGAPMIAMGLTAIGVGVGMGAASRAMPSGGSGGSKSTGTPQLAPASPVALDKTGGNAGPTTIVVNVPTVLSASGEDGQRIAMSIEQARREGRI